MSLVFGSISVTICVAYFWLIVIPTYMDIMMHQFFGGRARHPLFILYNLFNRALPIMCCLYLAPKVSFATAGTCTTYAPHGQDH